MAEERRRIVYDNKLPLTWVLSSAGTALALLATLLWNVAAQSNKLDQLIIQADKNEKANIQRDSKMESVIRDAYDSKRNVDILEFKINQISKGK